MNIGTVEAVRADRFAENGGFDYVALGHIHRPQSLGSETVRYAGSLLSYAGSQLLPLPARHLAAGVCAAAGLGCFALVKPLCQNGTAVAKKA